MAFAGMMTCLPTLPASAEVVHEVAVYSTAVHVTPISKAVLPVVARAGFVVTRYSVVQYPVPSSSRVGLGFSAGHDGVDLFPGLGTPVLAIADGVVTDLGNSDGGLGVSVTLQHSIDGQTFSTTYGHLGVGSVPLSIGETVLVGQQIGAVGSTGVSTAPHLHLEVAQANGATINPLAWLAKYVTE